MNTSLFLIVTQFLVPLKVHYISASSDSSQVFCKAFFYCGTTLKFFAVPFRDFFISTYRDIQWQCFSLEYAESIVVTVHVSYTSCIISMASTSKHLNEENVLDIINESDRCHINKSSDDSDDFEDDIAQADAAIDEENSKVEE